MKPISEQDHYEILEIPPDASREIIERAYRMAQSTYADDSLAGYSVFGVGDPEAIRDRIEIAYRVLIDAEARRAYDAALAGEAPPTLEWPSTEAVDAVVTASAPAEPPQPESAPPPEPPAQIAISDLDALDEEGSEFDGARLRRSRLSHGVEIEDISGVTKISTNYLRCIEEDRFAELPAPVYVRGFVVAYADCIGLDSKRVAASYMKNFESATEDSRRGRFLGGR